MITSEARRFSFFFWEERRKDQNLHVSSVVPFSTLKLLGLCIGHLPLTTMPMVMSCYVLLCYVINLSYVMLCYVGLCVLLQGFCNPFPHFPRRCFHLQLTGRWSVRALLANEQRQRTRRRIPLDSMCLQRRWLDKQWSGPATRHVHPFLFQWIYHHVTGLATSWAVTWRALRKNWFVNDWQLRPKFCWYRL